MTTIKEKVLLYLKNGNEEEVSHIAETAGEKLNSVRMALTRLLQEGKIMRVGHGKYKIVSRESAKQDSSDDDELGLIAMDTIKALKKENECTNEEIIIICDKIKELIQ